VRAHNFVTPTTSVAGNVAVHVVRVCTHTPLPAPAQWGKGSQNKGACARPPVLPLSATAAAAAATTMIDDDDDDDDDEHNNDGDDKDIDEEDDD
jgi:hypothetical protein